MKNRTMIISGLISVGILLSFIATAETKQPHPDSVNQLVAQTKKLIKTIDLIEFKSTVDKKDYDLIIDVREPAEYTQGYVPGAVNIPRGLIEFKIWPYVGFPEKTDTGKKIILYCMSGGRCSLAAKSLQDLGFTNVMSVDMAFKSWVDAGYPVANNELP